MKNILGKKNIYPQRLLHSNTEHHLVENKENNVMDDEIPQIESPPGSSQPVILSGSGPSHLETTSVMQSSSSSSQAQHNTPRKYQNKKLKNFILKEIRDDRRAYYKNKLKIEENI